MNGPLPAPGRNPPGVYIAIACGVAIVLGGSAFLVWLGLRRRHRRDEHHLNIITHGPILPPPPLPPHGPIPPTVPPGAIPPPGTGPRGPGAHGPGSTGRPDRPPLQGYYAPPGGGGAPSREEVEREAQAPVGGYYAPVYAPVAGSGPVVPAPVGGGVGPGVGGKYV